MLASSKSKTPTAATAPTMNQRPPQRSIQCPMNGAPSAAITVPRLSAPAISARLQPNSCCSGSMNTPSTGLKNATRENPTSATAPATHQPAYAPRAETKRGSGAVGGREAGCTCGR